ncbi:MAG TPA: DUF5694 domain-containing protein [Longimicrobium sp.]|nr:DUF5694 domain-containing protein [Longimicrobium sp.]
MRIIAAARVALLVLAAGAPLAAQTPARVMVLGTYHFGNPGLDVVKTDVADVLLPARQAEIERTTAALARFRPTKIVIEAVPSAAARWDSLYRAYRGGTHALARDEREQIGLRLAARLGHARVYPIDHGGEFPFGALMAYAQAHDTAAARLIQTRLAAITAEENRRQREMTVAGNLRFRNEPRQVTADHGLYLTLNAVGAGDGYAGAALVSKWYERNLFIFANLQRITQPGDRILVIYGSGHSAIFRELIRSTPGMTLTESIDYLPSR